MDVKKITECEKLIEFIRYKYGMNQGDIAREIEISEVTLSKSKESNSKQVLNALKVYIYQKKYGELNI